MSNLGLITARGGSERLPGKNTVDLDGKPLIAWTIEAAKESKMFDRLVCSTDDHGIAAVAAKYGCEVLERPKELAQADSTSLAVVEDAYRKIPLHTICLLQPTSPFRTAEDIKKSYETLYAMGADAVVSVTEASSDIAFELGSLNRLRPKPNTYVCNGAIYLITAKHLISRGDWYNGVSYAYIMPRERSIDIDTKWDLDRARAYADMIKTKVA